MQMCLGNVPLSNSSLSLQLMLSYSFWRLTLGLTLPAFPHSWLCVDELHLVISFPLYLFVRLFASFPACSFICIGGKRGVCTELKRSCKWSSWQKLEGKRTESSADRERNRLSGCGGEVESRETFWEIWETMNEEKRRGSVALPANEWIYCQKRNPSPPSNFLACCRKSPSWETTLNPNAELIEL